MALELKYSKDNVTFEIEESFLEDLERIGTAYIDDILTQMNNLCLSLDDVYNEIQTFGGVSHEGEALFFEISVLKEHGQHPFFLEVAEISTDEYLDYFLLQQTLQPREEYNSL